MLGGTSTGFVRPQVSGGAAETTVRSVAGVRSFAAHVVTPGMVVHLTHFLRHVEVHRCQNLLKLYVMRVFSFLQSYILQLQRGRVTQLFIPKRLHASINTLSPYLSRRCLYLALGDESRRPQGSVGHCNQHSRVLATLKFCKVEEGAQNMQ